MEVVEVEVIDGVVDAAGVVGDGEGAVFGADHLGESAGFEAGGHDHEVGGGVAEAGERFVEITATATRSWREWRRMISRKWIWKGPLAMTASWSSG